MIQWYTIHVPCHTILSSSQISWCYNMLNIRGNFLIPWHTKLIPLHHSANNVNIFYKGIIFLISLWLEPDDLETSVQVNSQHLSTKQSEAGNDPKEDRWSTSKSLNVNAGVYVAGNSYNHWEHSLGTWKSHREAFVDTFPGSFPRHWWIPARPGSAWWIPGLAHCN